jgi:hypothetical protein
LFRTNLIEEDLKNVVKRNDIISYKFISTFRSGKPKQPKIYQIRHDLKWDSSKISRREFSPKLLGTIIGYDGKIEHPLIIDQPAKWKKPDQRRMFLDHFAKFRNFDPLDAEKWYSITRNQLVKAVRFSTCPLICNLHLMFCFDSQGGIGVLNYYGRSFVKALVALYPELKLRRESFFQSKGKVLCSETPY